MNEEQANTEESVEQENVQEQSPEQSTETDNKSPDDTQQELSDQEKEEIKEEIKRIKKLQIKYKGKDLEEELPFEIPDTPEAREYMQKQLQLAKLSTDNSEQFSQLDKEIKEFVAALRENPKAILSDPDIGIDLKELARSVIEEEIENSKKTPEQVEKEKLQSELERLKKEQEEKVEEYKKRDFDQMQEKAYVEYDKALTTAFEEHQLPKTPYYIKKVADYMIAGIKAGHNVQPSDVLPLIDKEVKSDLKQMMEAYPDEVVQQLLGERLKLLKRPRTASKDAPASLKKGIPDTGLKHQQKTQPKKMTFKQRFGV